MMERQTAALNLPSRTLHLVTGSLSWTNLSADTLCNASDVKGLSDRTRWISLIMCSRFQIY